MATQSHLSDLVIGVSPCGRADARLVSAVCRAGGSGVLDLGAGDRQATDALGLLTQWAPGGFGVRAPHAGSIEPESLPSAVDIVLLGLDSRWLVGEVVDRHRVLVEVTSLTEARAAAGSGAHGLVAKGNEAGGQVGELGTFVLLQALLSDDELDLPVWAYGGIGLRTAAAAVAGGARGVVLDTQLALLAESDLPAGIAAAIRSMDGSEAVLAGGGRRHARAAVPVGQDGFLASTFATKFGTVSRLVRGIGTESVRITASEALRPGGPLCATLGTELPIAQGPMTRVSDEPAFANAVARAGALPFLALALADATRTRDLMTATGELLGDRPWGVGVLGFRGRATSARPSSR